MSTGGAWAVIPNADLSDAANWKKLGDNRYSAFRTVLYVRTSNGDGWRYGPIVAAHNVNPNDTITVEHRRERIVKQTDSASETLNESVSTRFLNAWTSKLASEAKSSVAGQGATLSHELTSTFEQELTTSLSTALSRTSSFEIQESTEAKHQIELKGGEVPREAHFRRRFWPRHWDVYLYSVEYLELSYRRRWFWWQVRETMKPLVRERIGAPLFRVTYYEPQDNIDVTYGPVQNELAQPERILVEPLAGALANIGEPSLDALDDLARYAFPTTSEEREEAETYRERTSGRAKRARKKGAGARKRAVVAKRPRFGAKKAGARKLASRRAGAKRSIKSAKRSMKVGARRAAAKRGAGKRHAARKAAKRATAKRARRK